MNTVAIDWLQLSDSDISCTVCRHSPTQQFMSVSWGNLVPEQLLLNLCGVCRSAFYQDKTLIRRFEDSATQDYWRNYAEIGAGLETMLRIVSCIDVPAESSLLDVGCGFGYAVDYWRHIRNAPAVGLEKASYGRTGREKLGCEIYFEHLQDCTEIAGRKFDVVLSSEVIEHVENPAAFLQELKGALAKDGLLILSTPSSRELAPENDKWTMMVALSPFSHYFVLSPEALKMLLEEAGFSHIHILEVEGRLVAAASNAPFPAPDFGNLLYPDYLAYLDILSRNEDRSVRGGALYRMLRDETNRGQIQNATAIFDRLASLARDEYGLDLAHPPIERLLRHEDWYSFSAEVPAWFSCALFYAGMLAAHRDDGLHNRLRQFDAASRLIRHEALRWPHFAYEALGLQENADFHFLQSAIFILMRESAYMLGTSVRNGESRPAEDWRHRYRQELGKLGDTVAELHRILSSDPDLPSDRPSRTDPTP